MFKIPKVLNPQVLFKATSLISGDIKVTQIGKERRLMVGGYVQSINWDCPGVEKRVWGKVAKLALDVCPSAKKILLLGLGAGTIVGLLKKANPSIEITAIELDEKVIEIAREYFGLLENNSLKVINADAFDIIENCIDRRGRPPSDVIIVDVYLGGAFPEKFWEPDFFEALKNILNGGGCVIFNRILNVSSNVCIDNVKKFLLKYFSKVEFEKVNIVGREGNVLFICKI